MYKIENYSGFFYVHCTKTGKLLIKKSFKYYNDAIKEAKNIN